MTDTKSASSRPDGDALVGVFSERDVVQRVVDRGLNPARTPMGRDDDAVGRRTRLAGEVNGPGQHPPRCGERWPMPFIHLMRVIRLTKAKNWNTARMPLPDRRRQRLRQSGSRSGPRRQGRGCRARTC
jgi:hypothetical protein